MVVRLISSELWRVELSESQDAAKLQAAIARTIPLRRIGSAREVAALAIFLATDEASYITGQAISVSGGITMN